MSQTVKISVRINTPMSGVGYLGSDLYYTAPEPLVQHLWLALGVVACEDVASINAYNYHTVLP